MGTVPEFMRTFLHPENWDAKHIENDCFCAGKSAKYGDLPEKPEISIHAEAQTSTDQKTAVIMAAAFVQVWDRFSLPVRLCWKDPMEPAGKNELWKCRILFPGIFPDGHNGPAFLFLCGYG